MKPSPPSAEKLSIEQLFDAEETPLLRYAYGICGRREVAEEIVQDAFLKLHKHWSAIEQPRAWLYRATRNLCLNHLRKHQRETLDAPCDDTPHPQHDTPSTLARMEAIGTLQMLIQELPPSDRDIVLLKYQEELSYGGIGKKLNIPPGTVGYRLHHLLKQLSSALQQSGIHSSQG